MVVNAYWTAPPRKTRLHMAARALMMSRCSQGDSAWVQMMPPGRTALCIAWKKGWGVCAGKPSGGREGAVRNEECLMMQQGGAALHISWKKSRPRKPQTRIRPLTSAPLLVVPSDPNAVQHPPSPGPTGCPLTSSNSTSAGPTGSLLSTTMAS